MFKKFVLIGQSVLTETKHEIVSMMNGCVCCTIRDDLLIEVEKLLNSEAPPEHIIIETSGVSKPVGVAETFKNPSVQSFVDVRIIAVLDAVLAFDEHAEYHNLAIDHVKLADLIVVNKVDLVTPQQLSVLKQKVESIAGLSKIWETTFGEIPLELVFDDLQNRAMADVRANRAKHPGHHHHDSEFASWVYRSDELWSFNALQRAVETLPQGIYRAKGMVQLDLDTGDYGILQVTGKRGMLKLTERTSPQTDPVSTEVVLIGSPNASTDESIHEIFEQALEGARTQGSEGYVVKDLRSFNVVFT